MFEVGDRVLYPMHGAGVIAGIEDKEIFGETRSYYVMLLPVGNLSVMIPTDNVVEIGLRAVVDEEKATDVLNNMCDFTLPDCNNWNKRYRDNMDRLRSGNIEDVAAVVKSLLERDTGKGLSTGERKMLVLAKRILVSEMVLSLGTEPEEVESAIDSTVVAMK